MIVMAAVLVHDIAGFSELLGREKSLLPDMGTRTLNSVLTLLEWAGGLCDKCIAVVGARFFYFLFFFIFIFYLAIAYGIGIITWISSSKLLPHKLSEIDCF